MIVDLATKTFRKVGNMNIARAKHNMKVVSINGKMEVIVFVGEGREHKNLDSIEIYDEGIKNTYF